jgi:hypothetical protein
MYTDRNTEPKALLDLALSTRQLPIWEPKHGSDENRKHIHSLQIPSLGGTPSLLLYDLGALTHDPQQLERISKIFKSGLKKMYAVDATCLIAVTDRRFAQISL